MRPTVSGMRASPAESSPDYSRRKRPEQRGESFGNEAGWPGLLLLRRRHRRRLGRRRSRGGGFRRRRGAGGARRLGQRDRRVDALQDLVGDVGRRVRVDDARARIQDDRIPLLREEVLDDRPDPALERPHLFALGLLEVLLCVLLHPLPYLLAVVGLLLEGLPLVLRHRLPLVIQLLNEIPRLFLDLVELVLLLIRQLLQAAVRLLARRDR